VRAVRERAALSIRLPRVAGYRTELTPDRLTATFTHEHQFQLDQTMVGPTLVRLEGLVGEGVDLTPAVLDEMRDNTVATHLTKHLLQRYMRDDQGNPPYHLYNSVQAITRRWIKECLILKGGTKVGMLTYADIAGKAAALIHSAIVQSTAAGGAPVVKAMIDPYNPAVVTDHVQFITTKTWLLSTNPQKCHVNYVVGDSGWDRLRRNSRAPPCDTRLREEPGARVRSPLSR
jgi:type III restriction enzyme